MGLCRCGVVRKMSDQDLHQGQETQGWVLQGGCSRVVVCMGLCRCEVVRKRADRDLLKSLNRLHQVEGLLIAMNDMDKACTSTLIH